MENKPAQILSCPNNSIFLMAIIEERRSSQSLISRWKRRVAMFREEAKEGRSKSPQGLHRHCTEGDVGSSA